MFVVAHHLISEPLTFWATVQLAVPQMGSRLQLHQVLPDRDGTEAVCVWEADSLEMVRETVERHVGHVSTNTYFEVDAKRAAGLPASRAAAAP